MMRRGIGRRGRPSVVGTVARTAVVAGTATAVAGSVSRHGQAKADEAAQAQAAEAQAAEAQQQEQMAAAQPAPAPAPAAPGGLTNEAIQQLQQLAGLRDQGILTEEEFAAQKAAILGM